MKSQRWTLAGGNWGAFLGWLSLALAVNAEDWPQFLGPNRNGVYPKEDLAHAWPKEGPPLIWKMSVGQGFSSPVVQDEKLILFHRVEDKETVDCLESRTGKRIWRFDYPTAYRDDFGFDEGPRATPSIGGGRVYTFGAEGKLNCLDLQSGRLIWSHLCREEFGAPKGFFGIACSPLLLRDKILLNMGGTAGAGIVAFNQTSGDVAWKSTDDEASYASGTAAALDAGLRAVFFDRSGLVGLDPDTGTVQFRFPWRSRTHASVNAATPLIIGDLIFLSACYETGAVLLRVKGDRVSTIWSSDEIISNHYSTSVYHSGYIFGFHGRQESGPALRCVELISGKLQWTQDNFGAGTVLLAGENLLVLKEDGQLLLLAASSTSYKELGRAQVLPNGVRAYPAIAGGFLFARGKSQLVCLDLKAKP